MNVQILQILADFFLCCVHVRMKVRACASARLCVCVGVVYFVCVSVCVGVVHFVCACVLVLCILSLFQLGLTSMVGRPHMSNSSSLQVKIPMRSGGISWWKPSLNASICNHAHAYMHTFEHVVYIPSLCIPAFWRRFLWIWHYKYTRT